MKHNKNMKTHELKLQVYNDQHKKASNYQNQISNQGRIIKNTLKSLR